MELTRRGRLAGTLVVVALLGAGAAYLVMRTPLGAALGLATGAPCTLTVGQERRHWSDTEAMTATTVAGVGTRIGASVNVVAAAVATSLEPPPREAISPGAAREVYRRLPGTAEPAEPAVRVAEALLGHDGAAMTCVVPLTDALAEPPREDPGPLGLTARADTVRLQMRATFGKQALGGFEPGGVATGHMDGSAHYEGRAVDVFFRPVTVENQRLGWQQAMWSVAHAAHADVATVIFDREVWTSARSVEGWRAYGLPGDGPDNAVLMHEDHVHVDVVEGR